MAITVAAPLLTRTILRSNNMRYKVIIIPTGDTGVGTDFVSALCDAVGKEMASELIHAQPNGYVWSPYLSRTVETKAASKRIAPVVGKHLKYEVCKVTVPKTGTHMFTVFRAENISTLDRLPDNGLTTVAAVAKPSKGKARKSRA